MTLTRKLMLGASAIAFATGCLGAGAAIASPYEATWPSVMVHLHGSGQAFLVDPSNDSVVATLPTGKGGTLGSTTPDGRKVYVGHAADGEDTVTVLDLESKSVVASIKTGARPKHPLVSPDGKLVVVNHWGLNDGKLRLTFIDTATDKVAKEVDIPVKIQNPTGVTSMHNGWSLDSRYAFTVDRVDDQFVVVDTQTWSITEIDVPSKPHYTVPSHDGKEVWVVVEGKDASNPPMAIVYALNDGKVTEKARAAMPLEGQEAVEGHHGNFTQDGKHFMMLNRGGGKSLVGTEVAVYDSASKKMVARMSTASTGIGHTYNTPDGRYAVVTNYGNNVVSIIDTKSWKVVKDLTIGAGRMGHVAFTKDGKYGYVSNEKDGNLFKIDMASLEVVGEVKTGAAPGGGQVLNVWTNLFEELPN